ncbi:UNVERIFIED_CONTAM: hypothetical protein NCL1_29902 [Trichonephila clavipes]
MNADPVDCEVCCVIRFLKMNVKPVAVHSYLVEIYVENIKSNETLRKWVWHINDERTHVQDETLIRFRAIPVTTGLRAFSEAVDVFILDPRGTVMRRWLSRQTNLGAVSLQYQLSQQPMFGNWTIRVIAQGQIEEKTIYVEEYYQTPFEVNVTLPAFVLENERHIRCSITAKLAPPPRRVIAFTHGGMPPQFKKRCCSRCRPVVIKNMVHIKYFETQSCQVDLVWKFGDYTSGAPVTGNLTLKARLEPLYPQFRQYGQVPEIKHFVNYVRSFYLFIFLHEWQCLIGLE